jgi:hypothetical protein
VTRSIRRSWVLAVALAGLMVLGATTRAGAAERFTITGEVGGLFPGFEGSLAATVTNPFQVAMRVTFIAGEPADAGPGCPASLLRITGTNPDVVLAPGATVTAPLGLHLDQSAPDACQDAIFMIAFRGTALANDLASTGSDAGKLAAIGMALVAVGFVLQRPRRRTTS